MASRPQTKAYSIRVDADAWEVLEWWASVLDLPLRSIIRQALEEVADEIIAAFVDELDEDMPPTVLLQRVRSRVEVPKRGTSGTAPPADTPDHTPRHATIDHHSEDR